MKAVAVRSTAILPVGQPGVSPGEGSAAGKMPAGPTARMAVLLRVTLNNS